MNTHVQLNANLNLSQCKQWKHAGGVILNIGTALRSEINLHYFGSSWPIKRLLWPAGQCRYSSSKQSFSVLPRTSTLISNTRAVLEGSFLDRAIQRSATTVNCMVTGVTKVQDTRI